MSVKNQIMEHLKEFTGEQDQNTLQDIYGKYRLSAIDNVNKLGEALPTGDFGVLYDVSHVLKGASSIVGFNEMWQHAALFVEGTKAHDMAKCKAEYEHIKRLATVLEE